VIDGEQSVIDGVRLLVRHPDPVDWERQKVRNEDSIVLELLWKNVSIVLTGDAGAETERTITQQFAASPLRVIKVGHHGSPTASTEAFIQALAPRAAVVSVGRSNTFGHPNPGVLERYRKAGAEIFRTDQDGAITLDTDGESIGMKTFLGRSLRMTAAQPMKPRSQEGHELATRLLLRILRVLRVFVVLVGSGLDRLPLSFQLLQRHLLHHAP
jgi:beta-lactamase superfamily II metal-dependent hydrolase